MATSQQKTAMKPEDEQNQITSENSFGTSQQMSLQTFVKTNAVDPLALPFSLCEHPSRRGGLGERPGSVRVGGLVTRFWLHVTLGKQNIMQSRPVWRALHLFTKEGT